jgi:N-acetylated-alpha-linked acidic dipeptidase
MWNSAASPSLSHLIRNNALKIPHPTKANKTLWDARKDEGSFKAGEFEGEFTIMNEKQEYAKSRAEDLEIGVLGSGSDYTVFLQRLGVASMDQGFGFAQFDPVYVYWPLFIKYFN